MSGYIVRYEKQDGTKGDVLSDMESALHPFSVEVFATQVEAEDVAQEMRDAYSYTGLKYSVQKIGESWQ